MTSRRITGTLSGTLNAGDFQSLSIAGGETGIVYSRIEESLAAGTRVLAVLCSDDKYCVVAAESREEG